MKRSPGQRRKKGFPFQTSLNNTDFIHESWYTKVLPKYNKSLIRWMASQERSDVIATMPESEAKRRRYI